ncbi:MULTISPECIES: hypothetical protein [Sphingobium]|mgnify:CR=1 FL=1|jgi:hypothetical protein|uniref:hypothetical protein n=1 Tax=Sphingobium TaxID=165695 RepID=UPI001C31D8B2|nr:MULTISPECIES: hypothetical protein [Sphingobium]MBV2150693.1 hypothetical protein [Sphingobium sp. AS12]MDH2149849.1 hypothetical protein [Sphingobium yanoikuyae]|tara:strand:+ start:5926 stop:6186 length:261 start_codon:yes stop_codon:yes gene_type:complete
MLRVFFGSEAALNTKSDSNGCAGAKASGSNTAVGRKAVHLFLKRWPQWLRADLAPADPLQREQAEDSGLAMTMMVCLGALDRPMTR